jgi:hypothetical protein
MALSMIVPLSMLHECEPVVGIQGKDQGRFFKLGKGIHLFQAVA